MPEKILQKKSYLSVRVKPQKLFRPISTPNTARWSPKKLKMIPKNKNNQKVGKLKIFKMKVIIFYDSLNSNF